MSAGAASVFTSIEEGDPGREFFTKINRFFRRAEKSPKTETRAYLPINHILVEFSNACKDPSGRYVVGVVPQYSLKKPDKTERRPDFFSFLAGEDDGEDDHLLYIWEGKAYNLGGIGWFPDDPILRQKMSLDIQKHLKSYLPQLSEQALFAFYEFKDDIIPSFLSEGNCFSLLLFVRPDNWDSLAEKYAEQLSAKANSRAEQRTPSKPSMSRPASSQAQASSSNLQQGPPGDRPDLAPTAARPTGKRHQDDDTIQGLRPVADGRKESSPIPKEALASATDADNGPPASEEEEAKPIFEEGDLIVPQLKWVGAFILTPDRTKFTREFLEALHFVIALRGLGVRASDPVFQPSGQEPDASSMLSLAVAEKAIKDFEKEQQDKKAPESISVTLSASVSESVQSEYVDPAATITRPRLSTDTLYTLRYRVVTWTSPVKPAVKPRRRAAKSGTGGAGPSKKRKLDQSGDAPTAQDQAAAGPSKKRVTKQGSGKGKERAH